LPVLVPDHPPGSCDICGLPATFDPEFPQAISYCRDCQQRRFAFQPARTYGRYEGPLVRRAILLLKYERIEPLGAWFAERLTEVVLATTNGGRPYVALLPCAPVVGLTIYEFCC